MSLDELGVRVASDEARKFCRNLVDRLGQSAAAKRMGVSRGTLAAVVAGFPVNAGTLALIEQAQEREPPVGPEAA